MGEEARRPVGLCPALAGPGVNIDGDSSKLEEVERRCNVGGSCGGVRGRSPREGEPACGVIELGDEPAEDASEHVAGASGGEAGVPASASPGAYSVAHDGAFAFENNDASQSLSKRDGGVGARGFGDGVEGDPERGRETGKLSGVGREYRGGTKVAEQVRDRGHRVEGVGVHDNRDLVLLENTKDEGLHSGGSAEARAQDHRRRLEESGINDRSRGVGDDRAVGVRWKTQRGR